jgi:hypothetical protein
MGKTGLNGFTLFLRTEHAQNEKNGSGLASPPSLYFLSKIVRFLPLVGFFMIILVCPDDLSVQLENIFYPALL